MIRDLDFVKNSMLEIELFQSLGILEDIYLIMVNKYCVHKKYAMEQLLIMKDAGLFGNYIIENDGGFMVDRLSKKGYDLLEQIRNEEVWYKTKACIEEKKLPKTIKIIAQVAGIFLGEFLKHNQ